MAIHRQTFSNKIKTRSEIDLKTSTLREGLFVKKNYAGRVKPWVGNLGTSLFKKLDFEMREKSSQEGFIYTIMQTKNVIKHDGMNKTSDLELVVSSSFNLMHSITFKNFFES